MDQKVVALESKMTSTEESRTFDSQTMTELNNKYSIMQKDMKSIKKAQASLIENENKMKEKLIDLKCREMRDNLLFYNHVKEERNETDGDCVYKVLGIMEDDMKISNARMDIKLHRAHRIGRFINGKTRPIVAKFVYYPERVRKASQVLRDTDSVYAVSQQYPKEVKESRRALVPIMKQARLNGSEAYIVVDKLYIDKQLNRGQAVPSQSTSAGVSGPTAGPSWGAAASASLYTYGQPSMRFPAPPVTTAPSWAPPMRLPTPGSALGPSTGSIGVWDSAPGHFFGPPHMSGETAGSMTESTTLQPEQLHGSSHAFNSTPGSNTGVPTTLEPGQYIGPSHTHIPKTGSSSIVTNGLNTGLSTSEIGTNNASVSNQGVSTEQPDTSTGSTPGVSSGSGMNDVGASINHEEMESDSGNA